MEVLFGLIGCAIPLIVLLGIVMIALRWNGNVNELRGQVEVLRAELRRMEREVKHLSEFVGRRSTTAPSMHKAAPQPESSSSIVAEQTHSTKQPTDNVAQETQDTVPQPLAESISAQDIDQPELDQSLGAKEFSPLEEMAERSVAAPLSTIDEVESQ
ncbi:hypothetical protein KFU94_34615 [Chloroflexi bacterium TSY]|nr:hypothetical protein [Chloroflexi bacterium TSY]